MINSALRVTYYYPWGPFHPVRSGAASVARAHMSYFRSRGIRPTVIVPIDGNTAGLDEFEREYAWTRDVCYLPLFKVPHIERCLHTWAFDSYLAGHAAMCDVPDFRGILSRPADLVFLNYIFSCPLLDALPGNAVRILESHDFISRQFLTSNTAPAVAAQHLSFEFELYSLFDAVFMINEDEALLARERGAANSIYVPQPVELTDPGLPAEESAGPLYDLLFVGSDHPPNVEGAEWFYEHVFAPHLKQHGLRWAIVGSVCRRLNVRDASVHLLGVVEDLARIYRGAKLVVIPLFRGAGISIKTLEALGQAKPIVTTACGRRGLKGCEQALVELDFQDDPRLAAERILHLCGSAAARRKLGDAGYQYVRRHFSPQAYGEKLDRTLDRLLSGKLSASPTAASRAA